MAEIKDTSAIYEDCVGVVDKTQLEPNPLLDLLGLEQTFTPETEEEASEQNWPEKWAGMPSYTSDELVPYKTIKVNFGSEEDFLTFCSKLGLKPFNGKSTWYPEKEKSDLSLLRWIDESELEE